MTTDFQGPLKYEFEASAGQDEDALPPDLERWLIELEERGARVKFTIEVISFGAPEQ